MKLGPRAKLVLIAALFAAPVGASLVVYHFFPPSESASYGELLAPAPVSAHPFSGADGSEFRFAALRGKWLLVVSDSGQCPEECVAKLTVVRQVRLALGRNADRVVRVLVVDDTRALARERLAPFEGTRIAVTPIGMALPPGAVNDRAHIYVVDPRGLVMMRFPARPDGARMLRDLNRLLRASQIG